MTLKEAYQKTRQFLSHRRTAYQLVFGSPAGQEVLMDLAKFCYANTTTLHEDARLHASHEGRREVWLRIQEHLNYKTDELYQIYGGVPVIQTEEDDA